VVVLLLALCCQAPAPAGGGEPGFVLDVGVALTMEDRQVVHNARILVGPDGRIAAVGRQEAVAAPPGWPRESWPDSWAFPGCVDPHTHVQTTGGDINDMVLPVNAELRVLDTVEPWNPSYRRACAAGVTSVNAIPGSGTSLSGSGVLVRLLPTRVVAEAVLRHPGSVKVAQGYNPERRGGDLGLTRMGMWWLLRHWLDWGRQAAADDRFDPRVDAVAGVYKGHHPFLVHTAGARDTYGTVRMFQLEAGVPVIVSHASFHGYMAAREVAAVGAALNIGPRNLDYSFNQAARMQGLVQAYETAGNRDLSVQTDAPVVPLEEFPYQATLAERLGCSTWEALEALNVDPAHQLLIDDQVGRLVPGLEADIVVKAGQPLDPRTPVQLVLVRGRIAYDIREGQDY